MDEQIAAELARRGVALIYRGEVIPADEMYAHPPTADYPRGYWRRVPAAGGPPVVLDATEVRMIRAPHPPKPGD